MKKFICVVLSVLMLASLGFSAFAQDWEDEWVDIDCSAAGVTLMLPSSLLFNSQGSVDIFAADELGYKSGVYVTYLAYIGVTPDEYYNGDYEEDSFAPLLQIVGLKENYDSNAFSGTTYLNRIRVNSASDYKYATNWEDYADKIYSMWENPAIGEEFFWHNQMTTNWYAVSSVSPVKEAKVLPYSAAVNDIYPATRYGRLVIPEEISYLYRSPGS